MSEDEERPPGAAGAAAGPPREPLPCAALLERTDWSATPLGPRSGWPGVLEAALAVVLPSPLAMTLLWGEEGVLLYNDAYARIAGARHPAIFGRTVREAWPGAVDFNAGVLREVLDGRTVAFQGFPFRVMRDGVEEQVHFDVHYWPIAGAAGPVSGLCTAVETTQAVIDARARASAEAQAQAEAARWRAAEERLRELLASTRAGYWHLPAGPTAAHFVDVEVDWDEGCRDLYGIGPEEPDTLATWRRRVHPADLARVEAAFETAVRGGSATWTHEFRIHHPTRGLRWIHDRIRLVRDDHGAPVRLMGLNFDVTERRQAELALAESEARFRTMADRAPVMIWMTDAQGRCVYVNRPWLEFTGLSDEAALGWGWADAIHPEDRPDPSCLGEGTTERFESRLRLRRADGVWRWVLNVAALRRGEQGETLGLIGSALDVTDHVESQQALEAARRVAEHMARHDGLTGLLARAHLSEVLESLLREAGDGARTAVLLVDLDEFKAVNDTMGHPAGDALLVQVARALEGCLAPGDLLGRLGGDEFLIVRPGLPDRSAAEDLARRVVLRLAAPFEIEGQTVRVGASVGIALAPQGGGATADDLVKQADVALYRAKAAGRGGFRVFGPELEAGLQERRRRRDELRGAVRRGEFELVREPIVDLRSGRPVGFEASVRWRHPALGWLGPTEIIGMAGSEEEIEALGAWCLTEACRAAAGWPAEQRVALSLPMGLAWRGGLAGTVQAALAETGLEPARLQLGTTGTGGEDAAARLGALRDLGVGLALEGFGAQGPSLDDLRRLPVDVVRVDRSFVAGLSASSRSGAILAALAGLGAGLGFTLAAAGIGTRAERDALQALGVREGQGPLFAPLGPAPLP